MRGPDRGTAGQNEGTGKGALRGPVVDTFVRHDWATQDEVIAYMPSGWRQFLGRRRSIAGRYGQITLTGRALDPPGPAGPFAQWTYPEHGGPGSDVGLLRAQTVDSWPGCRAAVLGGGAVVASTNGNAYLALELVRACNRWTAERWVNQDERLYGLILAPTHLPEQGALEIRTHAPNPRMAGVILAGNGLGRPFGNPVYHPLYEAAAEYELPLVIHYGNDGGALTHSYAGGLPSTAAEHRVLAAESLMTHLVSMIGQGVFIRYPNLRLLLVGGGAAWLPWVIWRFDQDFKALRREHPWLTRLPSEYLRQHVCLTTWPLPRPSPPERLHRLLAAFDGIEDMLCYASGYPLVDLETPDEVASWLPRSWWPRVFAKNAEQLFRFGARRRVEVSPAAEVGVMAEAPSEEGLPDTRTERDAGWEAAESQEVEDETLERQVGD